MNTLTLLCLIGLFCLENSSAFVNHRISVFIENRASPLHAVETVSLKDLVNHDEEGTLMAESIVKWLDDEWMPQDVHVRMAESAKKSYVLCREEGKDDVMDILMQVSNDLDANWQEYDADAFVNAWDIGNYVSDYLIKRSGNEGCECSTPIY